MSARYSLGAAALAAAMLGGCGSGTQSADRAEALRQLAQGVAQQRGGTGPATQEIGPAELQAAVDDTVEPLLFARFSVTGAPAIMIGIEENGPYTTFATQARQTVTLREGFLTATRGLGGDLMSSDIAGVRALVSARRAGDAQRVMRFLNAADVTYEVVFECRVTPGEAQQVRVGTREVTATPVTETCTGRRGREIENTYMVDAEGRAVASSQWGGDMIETVDLGVLRF